MAIFREVRRTLRDDGTLWLNLGDTYAANRPGGQPQPTNTGNKHGHNGVLQVPPGLKPKDLVGIPWRVAFALQADGWYLRSDIVWAKPNPMPESVRDRPTKSHEYLFLLTKRERYFYDAEAVKEPASTHADQMPAFRTSSRYVNQRAGTDNSRHAGSLPERGEYAGGRNRRSVWTISTRPYKEAHFATFPPGLVEPCILAGTSEHGACSVCGAPWERVVEVGEVAEHPARKGATAPPRMKATAAGQGTNGLGASTLGLMRRKTHSGWRPTCTCNGSFVRETYQDGTFEGEDGQEQPIMKTRRTYVPRIPLEDHPVKSCLVLDPFAGASTTGVVAIEHGRRFVGIELNPDYIALSERRLEAVKK